MDKRRNLTEMRASLMFSPWNVEPHQKGGRSQDVGACNPAVKAAIDGLVDAGILPDDSPEFVRSLVFLPPLKDKNSLVIYIRGAKKGRAMR
jgi:hypothetical protein